MYVPDELDKNIVRLLAKNANEKVRIIAGKLSANENTIRRRIKKLSQERLLLVRGFVNPVEYGLRLAAMIAFDVDSNKLELVAEQLVGLPEINWLSTCVGRFDLIAISYFPSNNSLSEFLMNKVVQIEGLKNLETFVCLELKKGPQGVILKNLDGDLQLPVISNLDKTDKRLVEFLGKDAWQKTQTLATRLKVSKSTVRDRIKNLTKSNILQIAGVVDISRFGFTVTAVIGFDVDYHIFDKFIKALQELPEVKWFSTATGRFDVVSLAYFSSNAHLSEFLGKDINKLDGLRNVEVFVCLDIKKGRYIQFS
jgi:Lrp/AsnC family transcriptional regulator, regulator for asnA, asnC and gidA